MAGLADPTTSFRTNAGASLLEGQRFAPPARVRGRHRWVASLGWPRTPTTVIERRTVAAKSARDSSLCRRESPSAADKIVSSS
jgi:hypothetical protein